MGLSAATYEDVKPVRMLVAQGGKISRLCKLGWTAGDASLYVFPYALEGRFHFGRASIPSSSERATVPFNNQETSESMPKLSVHESGQVHIRAGSRMVGPMRIPRLGDLRGEHVATVTCSRFERLPPFDGEPQTTGSEIDLAIPAGDGVPSGRLAIFMNGREASFNDQVNITARFVRPTLDEPLYLGFSTLGQPTLNDGEDSDAVVVTAGWHPQATDLVEQMDYLFVVTKLNRPGFIGGSALWVRQRSSGRVLVDRPPRTRRAGRNRSARAVAGG